MYIYKGAGGIRALNAIAVIMNINRILFFTSIAAVSSYLFAVLEEYESAV